MAIRKPGKKVGSFDFPGQFTFHKVELRIDMKHGEFTAEYMGMDFRGKDLDKLKAEIRAEVKKRETVEWLPFIEIDVKGSSGNMQFTWTDNCVGLDFSLHYIAVVGEQKWHKRGHVYKDRETDALRPECAARDASRLNDIGKSYIAYTDERWLNLTKIQEAINELRKRMRDVLVEATPDMVEHVLDDDFGGRFQLLLSGKPEK